MIAQVFYAFSKTEIMMPICHLLSRKVPFAWSPKLETAFQASKKEIIQQCKLGVRSFNPSPFNLPSYRLKQIRDRIMVVPKTLPLPCPSPRRRPRLL